MLRPLQSDDLASGERSLFTLLSLYLLLLAFFILLNSLTHPDESRTREVIRSVQQAFDHEVLALRLRGSQKAESGATLAAAAAVEELLGALTSEQPQVTTQSIAGSTVLKVELAVDPLFPRERARLLGSAERLLDGVANALLRQSERPIVIETEVLHGVEGLQDIGPDIASPAWLAASRASLMVRALIERGLDADRLAAGVLPRAAGRLQMIFRFYDHETAPADLAIGGSPAAVP